MYNIFKVGKEYLSYIYVHNIFKSAHDNALYMCITYLHLTNHIII